MNHGRISAQLSLGRLDRSSCRFDLHNHARATAKFVQCVDQFDADVTVTRCAETVGGTSIMGILTLGAGQGTTIIISALGPQAQEAVDALTALVADRFGEEE